MEHALLRWKLVHSPQQGPEHTTTTQHMVDKYTKDNIIGKGPVHTMAKRISMSDITRRCEIKKCFDYKGGNPCYKGDNARDKGDKRNTGVGEENLKSGDKGIENEKENQNDKSLAEIESGEKNTCKRGGGDEYDGDKTNGCEENKGDNMDVERVRESSETSESCNNGDNNTSSESGISDAVAFQEFLTSNQQESHDILKMVSNVESQMNVFEKDLESINSKLHTFRKTGKGGQPDEMVWDNFCIEYNDAGHPDEGIPDNDDGVYGESDVPLLGDVELYDVDLYANEVSESDVSLRKIADVSSDSTDGTLYKSETDVTDSENSDTSVLNNVRRTAESSHTYENIFENLVEKRFADGDAKTSVTMRRRNRDDVKTAVTSHDVKQDVGYFRQSGNSLFMSRDSLSMYTTTESDSSFHDSGFRGSCHGDYLGFYGDYLSCYGDLYGNKNGAFVAGVEVRILS